MLRKALIPLSRARQVALSFYSWGSSPQCIALLYDECVSPLRDLRDGRWQAHDGLHTHYLKDIIAHASVIEQQLL